MARKPKHSSNEFEGFIGLGDIDREQLRRLRQHEIRRPQPLPPLRSLQDLDRPMARWLGEDLLPGALFEPETRSRTKYGRPKDTSRYSLAVRAKHLHETISWEQACIKMNREFKSLRKPLKPSTIRAMVTELNAGTLQKITLQKTPSP
jgi:hypothetical protein